MADARLSRLSGNDAASGSTTSAIDWTAPPTPHAMPAPAQAPTGTSSKMRGHNPFKGASESKNAASTFIDGLTVLTRQEADARRQKLIDGFLLFWKCLDDVITSTNKAHHEAVIWQALDEEMTGEVVNQLLAAGMQNKVVAEATRRMGDAFDQFKLGMILGPKFVETWRFYMRYGVGI